MRGVHGRRLLAVLVSAALIASSSVASSSATSTADTVRLGGADRLGTAIAVSTDAWPDQQAQSVVLARWDAFPDALAGTPLAVAKSGPLLLTPTGSLSVHVGNELKRVLPTGRTVYLLGGTSALSGAVAQAVTTLGYKAVRLGGADRYATAVLINQQLAAPTTIFEATGLSFPYALISGVAAAKAGGAVVLTADRQMPAASRNYLNAHPTARRVAVGPEAAAADPGAQAVHGADKYETSQLLADMYFPSPARVAVASGAVFADALSGGAHAARMDAPLLLSEPTSLPPSTAGYLADHSETAARATLYGGPAALSADVEVAIRDSMRTPAPAPNPAPSPSPSPTPPKDTLSVDQRLGPDEALTSADGRYRLVMQASDGNLVVYGPGGPEWASESSGTPSYTVLQSDGNLVVYGPSGATWSSNTAGSGAARLVMQDDGNAVLYSSSAAVWSTRGGLVPPPTRDTLTVDQRLGPDESLWSADGRYRLIMQAGDGNLVLYGPAGAEWASGSSGTPSYTVLQGDGNLVVYGPSGATWNSGTVGSAAVRLVLQNDGNAVLYAQDGRAVWSSRDASSSRLYLPWTAGEQWGVSQGNDGDLSHNGDLRYALDFDFNRGRPILASAGGVIHALRRDVTVQSKSAGYGNFVVLKHSDGKCTLYAHMEAGSVTGKSVGASVNRAEQLGRVGNTGYTLPIGSGHHLHFHRAECGSYSRTIPIGGFVETGTRIPTAGEKLVSQNR